MFLLLSGDTMPNLTEWCYHLDSVERLTRRLVYKPACRLKRFKTY